MRRLRRLSLKLPSFLSAPTILQLLLKLRLPPHPPPPLHTRPQRLALLPTERRDDGDGVGTRGDDGRRGVEAHAADGDERRAGGHEAAPGHDAVEAARREGGVLGRRAEDGPERDVRRRERGLDRVAAWRRLVPADTPPMT